MSAADRFARHGVARRLFVVFVLSAFLPLAAIGILSFLEMRGMVLREGEQRLAALAKSYGMSLFERLALSGEIARTAADSRPDALARGSLADRTFRSLAEVDAADRVTPLMGREPGVAGPLAADIAKRMAEGRFALRVMGEGGAQRFMLYAARPSAPGRYVVGEIQPDFLWAPQDEWPAATEFCVAEEETRRVLHCPAGMNDDVLRTVRANSSAASPWVREDDGERLRARAWTQFMRAGFGSPDWIVLASQPESYHLARALQVGQVYLPVVGLALALVAWLTIRQSRNIVEPVERLAERARAIEAGDFGSRVGLERADEFGTLGNAFDRMSGRLGRQFASLSALSEIDRLILATKDISEVVGLVLGRIHGVVECDSASITLIDQRDAGHACSYRRFRGPGDEVVMERHAIEAAEFAVLREAAATQSVSLLPGEPIPGYLASLRDEGMRHATVHAISWRGDLCGVLALGFIAAPPASAEGTLGAGDLADRIAVAVSSAWRDEQLYDQAHFDALTGLPNRLLFQDRLEREIARAHREALCFAVLFVDLDHFKQVNDSLGHGAGDRVLREAGERISACVRDTDTVSRLGGDEFTVLLTALHRPQDAWVLAEAIVEQLAREFGVGTERLFLGASIGISSFPADGQTVEQLLQSADTAMYRAKEMGRAQAVFFEERMNAEVVGRMNLLRDLRLALERNEFVLHYQPQLALATGDIRSVEALIRWAHPTQGLVSPVRFIPLAEESGIIERIGEWTIREVCAQVAAWKAAGVPLERVSVNISPRQFRKDSLAPLIARCVAQAGIAPEALEIEITEGLLVETGTAAERMLRELSSAGHRISLDDFGTGFSSMSYLKRFPVDTIKIDRVFIDGIETSAESEAIVAAMIAMSHALGKRVVAEGVETTAQRQCLEHLGCDEIQGFLIAAGLPAAALATFLRTAPDGALIA